MGIIQMLDYQVRKPSVAQVAMQRVAATRAGAWVFARTLDPIDKALLRYGRGKVTLAGVMATAGAPILNVITTGARTGLPRSAALLGVPAGDDIAVIGSNFGQEWNPAWYHNMRANPKVQVTYKDKTVNAVAREAAGEERQAIWDRARVIHSGFDAYERRVNNRQIHVMILSAVEPQ